MSVRNAFVLLGWSIVLAAAAVLAFLFVLVESQTPDVLPDWLPILSLVLALVGGFFILRRFTQPQIRFVVLATFLLSILLWCAVEVLI